MAVTFRTAGLLEPVLGIIWLWSICGLASINTKPYNNYYLHLTRQPESRVVERGSGASLDCFVSTSVPPLTVRVRWFLNKKEIHESTGNYRLRRSGMRLKIRNITDTTKLGVYHCQVDTSIGSVRSRRAKIRLIDKNASLKIWLSSRAWVKTNSSDMQPGSLLVGAITLSCEAVSEASEFLIPAPLSWEILRPFSSGWEDVINSAAAFRNHIMAESSDGHYLAVQRGAHSTLLIRQLTSTEERSKFRCVIKEPQYAATHSRNTQVTASSRHLHIGLLSEWSSQDSPSQSLTNITTHAGEQIILPCAVVSHQLCPSTNTSEVIWYRVGSTEKRHNIATGSQIVDQNFRAQIVGFGNLLLNNVTTSLTGTYICTARPNCPRYLWKAAVRLSVLERTKPPYFINSPPKILSHLPGKEVQISCEASGHPAPVVSWLINSAPLGLQVPHRTIIQDWRYFGNKKVLHVGLEPLGKIAVQCLATNFAGDAIASTLVTALGPPILISQPRNITAVYTKQAVLHCLARAQPNDLQTFWFKDGDLLLEFGEKHNDSRFHIAGNGSLLIGDVQSSDEGVYHCSVHNSLEGYPPTESRQAFVNVVGGAPIVVNYTENTTVHSGTTVVFSCDAIGDPPPSIVWTFGKLKKISHQDRKLKKLSIHFGAHLVTEKTFLPDERATVINDTLIITGVQPEDTGFVTCRAKNSKGFYDASAFLTVEGPPQIIVPDRSVFTKLYSLPKNLNGLGVACKAQSYPLPQVHWHVVVDLLNTTRQMFTTNLTLSENVLVLPSTVHFHYVWSTCIAENRFGKDMVTLNFTTVAAKDRHRFPPWDVSMPRRRTERNTSPSPPSTSLEERGSDGNTALAIAIAMAIVLIISITVTLVACIILHSRKSKRQNWRAVQSIFAGASSTLKSTTEVQTERKEMPCSPEKYSSAQVVREQSAGLDLGHASLSRLAQNPVKHGRNWSEGWTMSAHQINNITDGGEMNNSSLGDRKMPGGEAFTPFNPPTQDCPAPS